MKNWCCYLYAYTCSIYLSFATNVDENIVVDGDGWVPSDGWRDIWMSKGLLLSGRHS